MSIFARQTLASSYYSYDNQNVGTNLILGFGLSEELGAAITLFDLSAEDYSSGRLKQLYLFT